MVPADLFPAGSLALAAVERVAAILGAPAPSTEIRTTSSQVAFRRRRGIESDRFREVARPAPRTRMHHLGLTTVDDIDDEVAAWLVEAARRAA